ncbi:ABC transporter substrate-binding protein [Antribacter sp. KLBMP9083]|uniref:ABC transporter substrate-binding protein n=1 Tax=Antribacter soli TaxID=2910976 RepID=A0AA41QD97_9MICO|nr:ABC transporter substrate-binding protein [Antribacter soli]MCF4121016.1 ABC transporter substrate-binding protein [Antribacter soli]
MNRILRATAALGVGALVVALSACVAETDTGTIQGAPSADADDLRCGLGTGEEATGEPIKVAAVATASGGVDFSSSPSSAKAYFDCVNDNGGINGRPVRYEFGDDALDPTKTAQLAAGYASDTSVVAMVGDATFVGCDVANVEYEKAGLYSITGVGVPQACFESSNIAPVNAGPRTSALATLQYFERQGQADPFFAIGLNTRGNGDWVADGIEKYTQQAGIDLVGDVLSDPAESNFLPLVSQVKQAAPASLVVVDPAPITASILATAEQQDAKGDIQWACTASCYDAQFGEQIGYYWEGFVANSELALVTAEGEDANQWRAVMDEYADADAPRDTFSQAGFLAAKIFVDALLPLDTENLDRETVSEAVLGVRGYESDLLCAPWYYGEADEHHANHATRMAIIESGTYVELEGCQDVADPDMAEILEREQSEGLLTE